MTAFESSVATSGSKYLIAVLIGRAVQDLHPVYWFVMTSLASYSSSFLLLRVARLYQNESEDRLLGISGCEKGARTTPSITSEFTVRLSR
jgi:hypothetical protein